MFFEVFPVSGEFLPNQHNRTKIEIESNYDWIVIRCKIRNGIHFIRVGEVFSEGEINSGGRINSKPSGDGGKNYFKVARLREVKKVFPSIVDGGTVPEAVVRFKISTEDSARVGI
ncbi:hypothetical protein AVEN_215700-1 [Araneus ventricosus]|uniref:Uncharacterized protein n=1 Tax=Araneus ventricosus TaxID=182803 RepID=A0A4Y2WU78_ARAVE|nr:hypothetical protein AVEN_215700-1 [Araneus ventricosus]